MAVTPSSARTSSPSGAQSASQRPGSTRPSKSSSAATSRASPRTSRPSASGRKTAPRRRSRPRRRPKLSSRSATALCTSTGSKSRWATLRSSPRGCSVAAASTPSAACSSPK
eukprot:Amastigsp_a180052_21.p4 type:complete len:112 gc:universal Amastigsp_a180052_21:1729-1394(-)